MRQLFTLLPIYGVVYAAIVALLSAVYIASQVTGIPVASFTCDPAALTRVHPLTGLVSNIGVLLWCATAASCFLTSFVLKRMKASADARFLFSSGTLTSVLMLDDLFMFHEELGPVYLHLPENLVFACYILMIGTYCFVYTRRLLETEYTIWLAACGFLALSMVSDVFFPGLPYLVEDGFKLFGIASWLLFYARTCANMVVGESIVTATSSDSR